MRANGFTLAELLIALVILGVIATFTIPKVLQSQQATRDKVIAKEVAGMVSAAYQAYKNSNTPIVGTSGLDLTPYMNYVKVDTVTIVDYMPTSGTTTDCSATLCLLLHNGAILMPSTGSFIGTTSLHTLHMCMDPDAKVSTGPGDTGLAICFLLYFDGRLTTRGNALPNSCETGFCPYGPQPSLDPSWFSWD